MKYLYFFLPVLCIILLFSQVEKNNNLNIFEKQINFYFISNNFSDLDVRDKENREIETSESFNDFKVIFCAGIYNSFLNSNTNSNIFLRDFFEKIRETGDIFLKIFSYRIIKKCIDVLISQFRQKEKFYISLISHLKLPETKEIFISGFSYLYLTARTYSIPLFLRC